MAAPITRNVQVPKINNQGLPILASIADAEPVPSPDQESVGNRGSEPPIKAIKSYGST
jgi:hypothetical protein